MSTTLIETIETRKTRRDAAALKTYREMVLTLANGGTGPTADAVEKVLTDAGKSPADLRADVDGHLRRIDLAAKVAKAAEQERELGELERRAVAANAKLDLAEREHADAMNPIRTRIGEIRNYSVQANRWRDELERGAPADRVEQYRAAAAVVAELGAKLNAHRLAIIKKHEGFSDLEHANSGWLSTVANADVWRQQGERTIAAAKLAEKEVPDLLRDIAAAQKVERAAFENLWLV